MCWLYCVLLNLPHWYHYNVCEWPEPEVWLIRYSIPTAFSVFFVLVPELVCTLLNIPASTGQLAELTRNNSPGIPVIFKVSYLGVFCNVGSGRDKAALLVLSLICLEPLANSMVLAISYFQLFTCSRSREQQCALSYHKHIVTNGLTLVWVMHLLINYAVHVANPLVHKNIPYFMLLICECYGLCCVVVIHSSISIWLPLWPISVPYPQITFRLCEELTPQILYEEFRCRIKCCTSLFFSFRVGSISLLLRELRAL